MGIPGTVDTLFLNVLDAIRSCLNCILDDGNLRACVHLFEIAVLMSLCSDLCCFNIFVVLRKGMRAPIWDQIKLDHL